MSPSNVADFFRMFAARQVDATGVALLGPVLLPVDFPATSRIGGSNINHLFLKALVLKTDRSA